MQEVNAPHVTADDVEAGPLSQIGQEEGIVLDLDQLNLLIGDALAQFVLRVPPPFDGEEHAQDSNIGQNGLSPSSLRNKDCVQDGQRHKGE